MVTFGASVCRQCPGGSCTAQEQVLAAETVIRLSTIQTGSPWWCLQATVAVISTTCGHWICRRRVDQGGPRRDCDEVRSQIYKLASGNPKW
eukprot:g7804.t1